MYNVKWVTRTSGTKICIACKRELCYNEFPSNGVISKTNHTFRPKPRCRGCQHAYEEAVFLSKLESILGASNIKCAVCGYDKCIAALDFHHIDPSMKEKGISYMKNYSEAKLKAEINKCIILCANHHREFHFGVLDITKEFKN